MLFFPLAAFSSNAAAAAASWAFWSSAAFSRPCSNAHTCMGLKADDGAKWIKMSATNAKPSIARFLRLNRMMYGISVQCKSRCKPQNTSNALFSRSSLSFAPASSLLGGPRRRRFSSLGRFFGTPSWCRTSPNVSYSPPNVTVDGR